MAEKLNIGSRVTGNYTIIDPKMVDETRQRIRKNMAPKIKEFNRKMNESLVESKKKTNI